LDYVDRETFEIIEYAELYAKGLPPVTGGALDQSHGFLTACKFIFGEQNKWKAKLGILS